MFIKLLFRFQTGRLPCLYVVQSEVHVNPSLKLLKIVQIKLGLSFQTISFRVFCWNCSVQKVPFDTNDSLRIKIVIYPYISHYWTGLWLCFCFFLLSIFGMRLIQATSAVRTSVSVALLSWEGSKPSPKHKVEFRYLNFKGLTEHLTLCGMERSSVCRKCNQNESGWMLRALLTMQTAETEALFVGTSRGSVAIEMTYISTHSWRAWTTPECPTKLRHQPADYSHQSPQLISHNKCKPLLFLAILICRACLWFVSMVTAVITGPCLQL